MTVGKTKDAGWQIGVSRTVDHPVAEVWDFITSPEGMALWLGDDVTLLPDRGSPYETASGIRGETRGFRPLDRVRVTWRPLDWDHDTTLQLTVSPAGTGRSRLVVHQERLADAAERERQRTHWKSVITAIAEALDATP
ncbi:SRPBCC domain-containing protein [Actinokineospora soli]